MTPHISSDPALHPAESGATATGTVRPGRAQQVFQQAWALAVLGVASLLGGAALVSLWTSRGTEARRRGERGDVPGWVLITLMTAGLVTVLWALAGDTLRDLFTKAIASVTGPGVGK